MREYRRVPRTVPAYISFSDQPVSAAANIRLSLGQQHLQRAEVQARLHLTVPGGLQASHISSQSTVSYIKWGFVM